MNYKIKKISGDASFREYYRVKKENIVGNLKYDSKEQIKKIEEEDEPVPLI